MKKTINFEELKGQVLVSIDGLVKGSEQIRFNCDNGRVYGLTYYQDCCASCTVEDICGDVKDLIGSEILLAELVTNQNSNPEGVPVPEFQDSFTWAFYKISTIKGSVTIRWYGESNGYYSEEATFERFQNKTHIGYCKK